MNETDKKAFRFLHVSTDEVYGSLSKDEPAFVETRKYQRNQFFRKMMRAVIVRAIGRQHWQADVYKRQLLHSPMQKILLSGVLVQSCCFVGLAKNGHQFHLSALLKPFTKKALVRYLFAGLSTVRAGTAPSCCQIISVMSY